MAAITDVWLAGTAYHRETLTAVLAWVSSLSREDVEGGALDGFLRHAALHARAGVLEKAAMVQLAEDVAKLVLDKGTLTNGDKHLIRHWVESTEQGASADLT
jgi:hypothetical protein